MNQNLLNIVLIIGVVVLFLSCGSDRANSTHALAVAGVVEVIVDSDNDGIPDAIDSDVNGDGVVDNGVDSDGDGIIDIADVDVDGDGVPDNGVDFDGDGINDAYDPDDDNDGLPDSKDPNSFNHDSDGDGIPDGVDVDIDGNGVADNGVDSDGDGINDTSDVDVNGDGVADNGVDSDGDGINDEEDPIDNRLDNDSDGLPDTIDPNDSESDIDGDGISDGADADIDGNGVIDNGIDTDRDGVNDLNDLDDDNDGLSDSLDPNSTNVDTDGDGIPDGADADIDGDGVLDNGVDSDGDGINDTSDVDVNGDGVPDNGIDSDGDGINDANDPDDDNDGLSDIAEEHLGTNPLLADSDGDGVSDFDEGIGDSDGDGIIDALESSIIDSDGDGVFDDRDESNHNPNNDSDGDGQVNVKELECSEGDALDATKRCPWIYEEADSLKMIEAGFVYVPGGFDVDEDGINEKGFWVTKYQARERGVEIASSQIISIVSSYSAFIDKYFTISNSSEPLQGYMTDNLTETLKGQELSFSSSDALLKPRISTLSAYLAMASLTTFNSDKPLKFLSHKQYVQIFKLLNASIAQDGNSTTLKNNLLGIDKNLPLNGYSESIYEFGLGKREYLQDLVWLVDAQNRQKFSLDQIERWWMIDIDRLRYNSISPDYGANATIDVGMGVGIFKDHYAVMVRAGVLLYLLQGTTGGDSDTGETTNGIGFRAATDYLP